MPVVSPSEVTRLRAEWIEVAGKDERPSSLGTSSVSVAGDGGSGDASGAETASTM